MRRYQSALKELHGQGGPLQPLFVLKNLVHNSEKAVPQYETPPKLPENAAIPEEDMEIVRAALITHPVFVTNEPALVTAIHDCEALHLRALGSQEALLLAQES